MKVKFQADADLNENIVKGLRRRIPKVDFKTATDAGFEGVLDEDVLSRAADDARVLVTHDRKTMPGHFGRFLEHRRSPGVIVRLEERTDRACDRRPDIDLGSVGSRRVLQYDPVYSLLGCGE